jgi:eight-cysteine-cluster-containing protein
MFRLGNIFRDPIGCAHNSLQYGMRMKKTMCAMWLLVGVLAIACSSKQKPAEDGAGGGGAGGTEPTACVPSGCSGTVCVEHGKEVVTTCEYKPEYDCYKSATCERQADTTCGWTQTDELTTCIETARASAPAGAEDVPQ